MEQEQQLQLHITKNDRKIITDFANSLSDKEYQLRCMWAIQILESKLTMINLELQENLEREVVVRLTHRIKSAESIFLKLRRKGYTMNPLQRSEAVILPSSSPPSSTDRLAQTESYVLLDSRKISAFLYNP